MLRIALAAMWVVFWIYWLVSARGVKAGTHGFTGWPFRVIAVAAIIVVSRLDRGHDLVGHNLVVHNLVEGVIGVLLVMAGLGLAVWARLYLGRNWGMPMSQKKEPELVTSGPYRFVRHPIYTGILLGLVGSALTVSLGGLVVAVVAGLYFYFAARVEEKNLAASMPAYGEYRAHTKMIIPFVL